LIDSRIRTLIEGYDKHINDLQEEIQKLEAKVNALTAELEQCAQNCERRLLPRRGLSD
jgi:prefoldin subunit 5